MASDDEAAILGEIAIRPMELCDGEAVAALLLALNRVENALTGDRHVTERAGHDCLAENEPYIAALGGAILVAETGGRVVGTLLMAFEEADAFVRPDLRACARVLDVCVDEPFRGRGVGRRLLAEAEHIAREAGRSAVLISAVAGNDRALGLYESAGFRPQAIELLKPLRPF